MSAGLSVWLSQWWHNPILLPSCFWRFWGYSVPFKKVLWTSVPWGLHLCFDLKVLLTKLSLCWRSGDFSLTPASSLRESSWRKAGTEVYKCEHKGPLLPNRHNSVYRHRYQHKQMSQRPKRKATTSLGDSGDTGIGSFRATNLKNSLFETFKNSNSGVVIKASIWVSTPKVSSLWEF